MNQRKSTILEDRDNWQAEAAALRAINADLLAALKFYQVDNGHFDYCDSPDPEPGGKCSKSCKLSRAAIKKAGGRNE